MYQKAREYKIEHLYRLIILLPIADLCVEFSCNISVFEFDSSLEGSDRFDDVCVCAHIIDEISFKASMYLIAAFDGVRKEASEGLPYRKCNFNLCRDGVLSFFGSVFWLCDLRMIYNLALLIFDVRKPHPSPPFIKDRCQQQ